MEHHSSLLRRHSSRLSFQRPLISRETKMRTLTKSFHGKRTNSSDAVQKRQDSFAHDRNKENHDLNQMRNKPMNHSAAYPVSKDERDKLIQRAIKEHRAERERIQKRVLQSRRNENLLNGKLTAALKEIQRIEREFQEFRRGANQRLENALQENKKLKRKLTMKHRSSSLRQDQLDFNEQSADVTHSQNTTIPRAGSANKPPRYVEPHSTKKNKDRPTIKSDVMGKTVICSSSKKKPNLFNLQRQRPVTLGGTLAPRACSKIDVARLEKELCTLDETLLDGYSRPGLAKSQSAYERRPKIRMPSFRSSLQRKSFERRSTSHGQNYKNKRTSLGGRASIKWATGCFEAS